MSRRCKKYILKAAEEALGRRRGWALARDLVEDVSNSVGRNVSAIRIARHLLTLVEQGRVERERVDPRYSLYHYRVLGVVLIAEEGIK